MDQVRGGVSPGYEAVRDAFAENFTRRGELGGACAAYVRGEKVVDLWGGIRSAATGEPWEEDTLALLYSATKGLAAMTMALAHSRGRLDYDERVAAYWPEFAREGKEATTVRQLLAHQAGLYAFREPVDRATVADLDRLAEVMARQKPDWPPGERQAYHGLTLGFYEGELLRRVDPRHRSLGRYFQEEIAAPLGLEAYIRIPASLPNSRLSLLSQPSLKSLRPGSFPLKLLFASFYPRSKIYRALGVNPGSEVVRDPETVYARELEVPAGGGVATARAIAAAYGEFATGGKVLGLKAATLRELEAPARPPRRGFHDEALLSDDVQFSLGFAKPSSFWSFGGAASYGSLGAGGSMGYADPARGLGYGYVTSRMGTSLRGDPRDLALREALDRAVERAG